MKSISSVVLLLALTACSTFNQKASDIRAVTDRQAELAELKDWNADGRIALKSPSEATNLALSWKQRQSNYSVALTAPLGARVVNATQNGDRATLQIRGRAESSGRTVEELVRRHLSVPVPMRQLSFWLRGMPGEGENPDYDAYGRLRSLNYTDAQGTLWKAVVTGYSKTDDIDLPALIEVKGARNEIIVSIRQWTLGEDTQPTDAPKPGPVKIPGVSS